MKKVRDSGQHTAAQRGHQILNCFVEPKTIQLYYLALILLPRVAGVLYYLRCRYRLRTYRRQARERAMCRAEAALHVVSETTGSVTTAEKRVDQPHDVQAAAIPNTGPTDFVRAYQQPQQQAIQPIVNQCSCVRCNSDGIHRCGTNLDGEPHCCEYCPRCLCFNRQKYGRRVTASG